MRGEADVEEKKLVCEGSSRSALSRFFSRAERRLSSLSTLYVEAGARAQPPRSRSSPCPDEARAEISPRRASPLCLSPLPSSPSSHSLLRLESSRRILSRLSARALTHPGASPLLHLTSPSSPSACMLTPPSPSPRSTRTILDSSTMADKTALAHPKRPVAAAAEASQGDGLDETIKGAHPLSAPSSYACTDLVALN